MANCDSPTGYGMHSPANSKQLHRHYNVHLSLVYIDYRFSSCNNPRSSAFSGLVVIVHGPMHCCAVMKLAYWCTINVLIGY